MPKNFSHNHAFLKVAYDHLSEGIIVLDDKKLITYANSAAGNLIGKKAEGLIGKKLLSALKFIDSVEKKKTDTLLNSYKTGEKSVFNQINISTYHDNIRLLNLDVTFVNKPKTTPFGYILKISESSREEDLLKSIRESEKKYKGLFEHAQEGILLFDNQSEIIDFNPSASRIYERKDFYGMSIMDLFPHNSKQENQSFWKKFLAEGKITGLYKYVTSINELRYIEFKAKANYLPGLHLAVLSDETDKRLTEKALLKSEANLKAIFDNSEQSILLLDVNYIIIASNINARQAAWKILGKTLVDGENILNFIINKELFVNEFNKAKKGDKVVVERNIIGINGEDNWVEFTYIPIKNGQGKVINICYSSQNINNRKKEALTLKESEEKFRSLSENSPDIIYIIDLDNREVSYFNRENILGYPTEMLKTSESWIDIVSPEDYNEVVEHWNKFLKSKSKKPGSIEYRIRNYTGTYEWVSNRHIVIEWDKKGNPLKILLNITVITERIKAQEALKESETRLKALIENTTDLVWSIDNEFNITALNAAFKDLISNNYKKKIKLGDNIYSLLPGLHQDGWLALHVTALKGKRVTAEFSWQTRKKENLFYEISYNPIYDTYNNVNGVSVFARDVTQRKNNEATIVQTNFELDSFVYRASHDLRAPLRSILGLVNIINNQSNEDDKVNYLKLIEKSAFKLDNFISDLINFSRNSRASVDIEEVDFAAIIAECKENIGYMDGADKVEFTYKVKGIKDFYSDNKRITIFMNNLLSNAIKYQDQSGKRKSFVSIQVIVTKKSALITIQDNGVGIKKEYQPKIFNMFFRASESSYGSGLGLYIARQAVERLGGEIKVESKLNVGTTFSITLPNLEDKMFDFTSM